ncbi:MAG: hypothetical protein ABW156_11825 [Jiangellaceae bacterium]
MTATDLFVDIPIELVATAPTCAAGYRWCQEKCEALDSPDADPDSVYHGCRYTSVEFMRLADGGWTELFASLHVRHDPSEDPDAGPMVLMVPDEKADALAMTAEQARQNAAWLLNAADLIDPLPVGAMVTTAVNVRIGDELLTGDGWQKVTGLLFDAALEQASVFTTERTMDDDSGGWDLSFNDPVKVRRPVHGSCAIQFVEPIR